MKLASLAPLLLLATGCYFAKTKEHRPWDAELVAKIEPGKTTKAQVLQLLGPPKQIVRLLDSEAYMYSHAVNKETGTYLLIINLSRSDTQFDAITVIINRQDLVTAVGHRFDAEQAGYGFPWQD